MSAVYTRPAMSPVGAGWARERLWLGMTNVGTWVVLATAGLLFGAPVGAGAGGWAAAVGATILVQAPFDLVGGYLLPHRHHRPAPTLGRWVVRWARPVAVHAAGMLAVGWTALALLGSVGPAAVVLVGTAGAGAILALQLPIWSAITGHAASPLPDRYHHVAREAGVDPEQVRVVDTTDPGFVGGWTGVRGRTLVVPRAWLTELDRDVLRAQLTRRAVAVGTSQRVRGGGLALAWHVVGLVAAALWVAPADAAGLVLTVAAFTLWSFLGLLVLPTPSRRGVYAVDAAAHLEADLRPALAALDRRQDDEPARSDLVETVFHPVPALGRRLTALGGPTPTDALSGWNAARTALLLGWAGASPLSRAVHCNVGRTELWAMFPGD